MLSLFEFLLVEENKTALKTIGRLEIILFKGIRCIITVCFKSQCLFSWLDCQEGNLSSSEIEKNISKCSVFEKSLSLLQIIDIKHAEQMHMW